MYSWQYGFIEDKTQEDTLPGSSTLLRKNENRKIGKALMNPLKRKVQSESPHKVKSAAGAVYRKSDIAKAKIVINEPKEKPPKKVNTNRSPHGNEPKTKSKKKEVVIQSENSDSDDLSDVPRESNVKDVETPFQDSQHYVTSKDTEVNGGLNLTGKRAKSNNAGPVLQNPKTNMGEKQNAKRQSVQESRKKKAGETAAEAIMSRDNDLDI